MFSKAILLLSIATAVLAKIPETKVTTAGLFQNLFFKMKKAEKSNDIATNLVKVITKSLTNTKVANEVKEFFSYVDMN